MKNQAYIVIIHQQNWKEYTSYYIMESNGHAMVRVTQTDDFEISDLYVEEKYRCQGLGEYMLDYAIGLSKRVAKHGTIFISTNKRSAEFCDNWYQRLGFTFDHMETPLCLDSEDDVEYEDLEWYKVYKLVF